MEYFEIEKDNNKKINKNKNYHFLAIFIFLIILFFAFFFNLNNRQKYSLEQEDKNEKLEFDKYEINLKIIEKYPHLLTEYIFNLLHNYDKLDLTIFKKNINTIKQRIYEIISNKNENRDLYKILSTIYGAFLADSMGSFCEFKSFNKNNHLSIFNQNYHSIFKPGQVTDDSEMAMSQAYAIMDNPNYKTLNYHLIYYYYVIWYNSNPLDIGMTTRNALNIINIKTDANITNEIIFSEKIKNIIKNKNSGSLANGLLMRISPILTWFYIINKNYIQNILETKSIEKYYELYNKIFIEIEKDGQLTHPNRENSVSGAIFIFMGICSMEQKYSGKEILEMIKILFEHQDFNIKKEEKILKNHFNRFLSDFGESDFIEDKYFGDLTNSMGYYLHAFKLTLYYLYNLEKMEKEINIKDIYNNIIFSICDFGGDTDTNAAIVGMIIGPLIGLENFNNNYFDIFLNFYSKKRLIYTNTFIYFYAKYLIEIVNNGNDNVLNNKVNFNFYKMLDIMFNKEL